MLVLRLFLSKSFTVKKKERKKERKKKPFSLFMGTDKSPPRALCCARQKKSLLSVDFMNLSLQKI